MTNTHINVGGHKITTNKVGSVHIATINTDDFTTTTGSTCAWVVTNGICHVYFGRITPKRAADPLTLTTNLPKAKMYFSALCYDSATTLGGYVYIGYEGTTLLFGSNKTNMIWCSFSYPVADDWVES